MSRDAPLLAIHAKRARWHAFLVLCLGALMVMLDATVVNVALPSIRTQLQMKEGSLVWVVNAYALTYGGSLLLCARLSDLYGPRRVFLLGISLFTVASLLCGLASGPSLLIGARAAQGFGGAAVVAVALSFLFDLFPDERERARAMGVYGFLGACGGSVGLLLGGVFTSVLSWRWALLINLPIGAFVYVGCRALLPDKRAATAATDLDVGGALAVTAALMCAIYAIVDSGRAGWLSAQTLFLLGGTTVLLIAFLAIESRARAPLMPLCILKRRKLAISNLACALWAAGAVTWFFVSALYMQRVLGFEAIEVALAFLPANIVAAAISLGVSARLVSRFGIRVPCCIGMLLAATGLVLFAWAPVNGVMSDVVPAMTLYGLGAGIAFNPLLIAATDDLGPAESGIVSGIVNTTIVMGGALGLAVLTSISAATTRLALESGASEAAALASGYHIAFLAAAACIAAAAILAAAFFRAGSQERARACAAADSDLTKPPA